MAQRNKVRSFLKTQDSAHRGYLIRRMIGDGCWFVEKDGHFITYALSVDDAKREIDELTTA